MTALAAALTGSTAGVLTGLLFGLDRVLGTRVAEVQSAPGTLDVVSSNAGFYIVILLVAGIGFFATVTVEGSRAGGRAALGVAWGFGSVLAVCLLIMAGVGYGETRLIASAQSDCVVIETRGILQGLWVKREEVPVADLVSVGIATGTVSAATRNGTPQGRDRTAYNLRLRTSDRRRITVVRGGIGDPVPAARAVLVFLADHPARKGLPPLDSNLTRYGFDMQDLSRP